MAGRGPSSDGGGGPSSDGGGGPSSSVSVGEDDDPDPRFPIVTRSPSPTNPSDFSSVTGGRPSSDAAGGITSSAVVDDHDLDRRDPISEHRRALIINSTAAYNNPSSDDAAAGMYDTEEVGEDEGVDNVRPTRTSPSDLSSIAAHRPASLAAGGISRKDVKEDDGLDRRFHNVSIQTSPSSLSPVAAGGPSCNAAGRFSSANGVEDVVLDLGLRNATQTFSNPARPSSSHAPASSGITKLDELLPGNQYTSFSEFRRKIMERRNHGSHPDHHSADDHDTIESLHTVVVGLKVAADSIDRHFVKAEETFARMEPAALGEHLKERLTGIADLFMKLSEEIKIPTGISTNMAVSHRDSLKASVDGDGDRMKIMYRFCLELEDMARYVVDIAKSAPSMTAKVLKCEVIKIYCNIVWDGVSQLYSIAEELLVVLDKWKKAIIISENKEETVLEVLECVKQFTHKVDQLENASKSYGDAAGQYEASQSMILRQLGNVSSRLEKMEEGMRNLDHNVSLRLETVEAGMGQIDNNVSLRLERVEAGMRHLDNNVSVHLETIEEGITAMKSMRHGASTEEAQIDPAKKNKENKDFEWKKALTQGFVESIGAFLLVLFSCGTAAVSNNDANALPTLAPSLVGGFVSFGLSYTLGPVTGCGVHLNPLVTIFFAVFSDFPWSMVPIYIAAQLLGGNIAPFILRAILGNLKFHVAVEVWWRPFVRKELSGFVVASTLVATQFFGGPVAGGSTNPVVSLGCAITMKSYNHLWQKMIGQAIGMLIASALYSFIFDRKGPAWIKGFFSKQAVAPSAG